MNSLIILWIFFIAAECNSNISIVDEGKEPGECDIFYFAKNVSSVSFTCRKRKNNNVWCKAYCTVSVSGVRASPGTYECKPSPDVRGGSWNPPELPGCDKTMERCNIWEFTKDRYNIDWHCIQNSNLTEMTCKPFCRLEDEYLTGQREYKCKVTTGYQGGKWQPDVPPSCEKEKKIVVTRPPIQTTTRKIYIPPPLPPFRGRSEES